MDISYLLALQNFRETTGGVLDSFMIFLSTVSSGAVAIIIPALFIWCINKKNGYYMMFSFSLAVFLNQTMKLIACVYRPWIRDSRIEPMAKVKPGATGYSFPSGHTTNASSLYGSVAVSYRQKKWIPITLVILILLIGFSRNYSGVHTPQDVLVGLLCGAIGMFLACFILKWAEEGKNRDLIVCGIGLLMIVAAMILIENKTYPLDYVNGSLLVDPEEMKPDFFAAAGCFAGLLIAWITERRLVKFSVEGTVLIRIVRFVAGVAVILLMQKFLFPAICSAVGLNAGYFIRGIILYLFILVIYPWVFTLFERTFVHKTVQE